MSCRTERLARYFVFRRGNSASPVSSDGCCLTSCTKAARGNTGHCPLPPPVTVTVLFSRAYHRTIGKPTDQFRIAVAKEDTRSHVRGRGGGGGGEGGGRLTSPSAPVKGEPGEFKAPRFFMAVCFLFFFYSPLVSLGSASLSLFHSLAVSLFCPSVRVVFSGTRRDRTEPLVITPFCVTTCSSLPSTEGSLPMSRRSLLLHAAKQRGSSCDCGFERA